MLKTPILSKFILLICLSSVLSGCGQPDPTDWYSYRSRDRQPVEVKVESAEILPGDDKHDIIRIKMIWKNPGNEKIVINDEKFSLDVSDVKLNPETFQNVELDPGQELEQQYDFLLIKSFVDKTKYKLVFENWAEIRVLPVRN